MKDDAQRTAVETCCSPETLARGMAALAHPARIEILCHLAGAEPCCCKDVVGRMSLAQSTVSQHLKVLLEAGLVRVRPDRQRSNYTVDHKALLALSEAFNSLAAACAAGGATKEEEKI